MARPHLAIVLVFGALCTACGGGSHGGGALPPETRDATALAPKTASSPDLCPPALGISVNGSLFETGQIVNLTAVYQTFVQKIVLGHERCEPSTSSNPDAKWSTSGGIIVPVNGGKAANFSSSTIGTFTITAKYLALSANATVATQRHNETFIADFPVSSDGNLPFGPVLRDGRGDFFGITLYGANDACFCGTVYEIEHASTGYIRRVLYAFKGGTDGAFPSGALAESPAGELFGSSTGGGNGQGVVFKLTPAGGSYIESVIYRSVVGGLSGVIREANGDLYGTTTDQYNVGNGVVYKMTPSGASYTYTVIYAPQGGSDGSVPSSLVLGNNVLYGTTDYGGDVNNNGTVFELIPSGSHYVKRTLYRNKGGSDGRFPDTIILGPNGTLLGTTKGVPECSGQTLGLCGTVFELTPSGSGFAEHVLHRFNGLDGSDPRGLLLANGVLYGTTDNTAYSLTLSGSFRLIHTFCGNYVGEACSPNGPLVRDASGALYGSAQEGGSGSHGGVIFRLTP